MDPPSEDIIATTLNLAYLQESDIDDSDEEDAICIKHCAGDNKFNHVTKTQVILLICYIHNKFTINVKLPIDILLILFQMRHLFTIVNHEQQSWDDDIRSEYYYQEYTYSWLQVESMGYQKIKQPKQRLLY